MSRRNLRRLLFLAASVALVAGTGLSIWQGRFWKIAEEARDWPRQKADVLEIGGSRSADGSRRTQTLRYSYETETRVCVSQVIRPGETEIDVSGAGAEVWKQWMKDPVVHVRPGHPEQAVLLPGATLPMRLRFFGSLALALSSAVLWWFGYRLGRESHVA